MSETETPIRDAAALIVIDRSAGEARVLMGRRRPDQVFLPNVFVFPGGRVDDTDAGAPSADELLADESRLLALPREDHAESYDAAFVRGLALAAVRETFEETGLVLGRRAVAETHSVAPAWQAFVAHGVLPQLSTLRYFMRAITPKLRPRRYDTRFFLADADDIAVRTEATDEELSEIGWYDLPSLKSFEVPRMTRFVLDELERLENAGLEAPATRRLPFFFERDGVAIRAELSLRSPSS